MLTTAWSTPKRNIDSYRFVKFWAADFKVLESVVRKNVRVVLSPSLQSQNGGGQQVNNHLLPVFVSLNRVSPAMRYLVSSGGGFSDVANVVLEQLPITSAFYPHVCAAICRLPVDGPAVRHDR